MRPAIALAVFGLCAPAMAETSPIINGSGMQIAPCFLWSGEGVSDGTCHVTPQPRCVLTITGSGDTLTIRRERCEKVDINVR